jgi:ABC-2 type transport system permease protein
VQTLLRLTSANLKSFTRDRAAMFWTLAFPLVFILLFGAIFSGGGVSKFTVAWVDADGSPASTAMQSNPALANVFTLNPYATTDDAIAAMKQGDVRAVLVIPKGFGSAIAGGGTGSGAPLPLTVYTDPSNQQVSATITGIVASMAGGFNQAASGRPPILALDTQTVQSQGITAVAYLVPSILAMALMQLGLFSAIPIVEQRESLILKRIAATPIKRRTFIAANVITRLLIALVQAVVILVVAQTVFGITLLGSPLVFTGLVILGALAFIALGYVVASFAPTEDSASQMVSILQFPLMFLSGIFFALESLPSVLRGVAAFMPLTYLGDALRQVMVGGTPFVPLGVGVAILGAWLIGCFLVSARFFRWQ